MGDAPNELEVLEARREILQLEIALAQERRAAAEAEQKGKKAADEGGEPTLDYVVPASYPDARHAESLPTAGILRRGKPTLLSLPSNPVLQHPTMTQYWQIRQCRRTRLISFEPWLPPRVLHMHFHRAFRRALRTQSSILLSYRTYAGWQIM